jgi:putative ABC transport system ATP-binding protein
MPSQVVLETRKLSKRFANLKVLENINLKVHQGERLAITGPSGSGKSTLLGILAGLEAPSEGEVLVEGQALGPLNEEALAAFRGRRIGFVFQSFRLLPTLSAVENVRVPLELAGRRDAEAVAVTWLERVGLKDRLTHLPAQLSGGEQQRVALARAMAPEPAIILADEPTGNLDSKHGKLMKELLFGLLRRQKATLVLVTHDEKLAREMDRILRMQDGRIRA